MSVAVRLNPTWDDLVAHEPRLNDLLADARSVRDDNPATCCMHDTYVWGHGSQPSFKNRLDALVGWYRPHKDPLLSTSEAWFLTVQVIQHALPPCRHCGCVGMDGRFVD